MPGPVSDSYDPEWSTATNRDDIDEALLGVYQKLNGILKNKAPLYILDLVHSDCPKLVKAELSEKEWRLLRFSVERARDSL